MSDNVQVVRRAVAALLAGDQTGIEEAVAADVVWYGAGEPDGEGACRIRDEVAQFVRSAIASGVDVEVLEVAAVGDGVLLVLRASGPELDLTGPGAAHLVKLDADRIVEIVVHATRGEALKAAGAR